MEATSINTREIRPLEPVLGFGSGKNRALLPTIIWDCFCHDNEFLIFDNSLARS